MDVACSAPPADASTNQKTIIGARQAPRQPSLSRQGHRTARATHKPINNLRPHHVRSRREFSRLLPLVLRWGAQLSRGNPQPRRTRNASPCQPHEPTVSWSLRETSKSRVPRSLSAMHGGEIPTTSYFTLILTKLLERTIPLCIL